MKPCNIVWFRRDLRLSDNEIISQAAANGAASLFVFTLDPWFFKQPEIGGRRVRFLLESLQELDANLRRLGAELHIICGESTASIQKLLIACRQDGFDPQLYFNRDIQVEYGLKRDAEMREFCRRERIALHEGSAYLLLTDPAGLDNWYERYYAYQSAPQWHLPEHLIAYQPNWLRHFDQIRPAQLLQTAGQWLTLPSAGHLFHGGETEAQKTLRSFLTTRYHGYHWKLSRPYLVQRGATSGLSPHIAFGTISTRQVFAAADRLRQRLATDKPSAVRTIDAFLSRLRWRDSFTQRLQFFPKLIWQNRYYEFDAIYLDDSLTDTQAALFEAWKAGQTGFPLLDASMRQLATDGFINFRMRAQAVTMLCIIFGVSWQHGARYFMQQLIDGDIAINHWQWQMQAGIVNPLSPSFRIYSPDKNLRERDPRLQYVHYWLPESCGHADIDQLLVASKPIVNFSANKNVYGAKVSALRRQVRIRLLQEQGADLLEAQRLFSRTQRLDTTQRQPVRKAKIINQAQATLFELGDG